MQKTWIKDVSYNKEMFVPCLIKKERLTLYLISLEASDPELGKMWTERIDGMVVYTPTELEERLYEAGFSSIRTIRKKEEIHIIAHK